MSVTFLAWLAALEMYKFANKFSGPEPYARDANIKSSDVDEATRPAHSDRSQAAPENDVANEETSPSRHARVEDTKPNGSQENADLNHSAIGSSTDPEILAPALHSSPTNAIAVGFPPSGTDLKSAHAELPSASPSQPDVLPVAGRSAPTPDTIAPTVPSVVASGSGIDGSGNGDLNAGHLVTLTINMSEVVTVAGGVPTLSLNNGGTASYTGGSGSNALTFSYTVGAGDDTSDLAVTPST